MPPCILDLRHCADPPFFRTTRTVHLDLGVFCAPMLLFFDVTGGLQTFGLHESSRGSSYVPPAWLVSAAQLHKKQTTAVPPWKRRPQPVQVRPAQIAPTEASRPTAPGQRAEPANEPKRNLAPMKIFFALIALSLFTSLLAVVAVNAVRLPVAAGSAQSDGGA